MSDLTFGPVKSPAPDKCGNAAFRQAALEGLAKKQKTISPKFLYDEKGSRIFEKICEVQDYYPTRTEKNILQEHASEIAEWVGPQAIIIEPGSGNGEKFRLLRAGAEAIRVRSGRNFARNPHSNVRRPPA